MRCVSVPGGYDQRVEEGYGRDICGIRADHTGMVQEEVCQDQCDRPLLKAVFAFIINFKQYKSGESYVTFYSGHCLQSAQGLYDSQNGI